MGQFRFEHDHAGDGEGDEVGARAGVGVFDRLAQRPETGVIQRGDDDGLGAGGKRRDGPEGGQRERRTPRCESTPQGGAAEVLRHRAR